MTSEDLSLLEVCVTEPCNHETAPQTIKLNMLTVAHKIALVENYLGDGNWEGGWYFQE